MDPASTLTWRPSVELPALSLRRYGGPAPRHPWRSWVAQPKLSRGPARLEPIEAHAVDREHGALGDGTRARSRARERHRSRADRRRDVPGETGARRVAPGRSASPRSAEVAGAGRVRARRSSARARDAGCQARLRSPRHGGAGRRSGQRVDSIGSPGRAAARTRSGRACAALASAARHHARAAGGVRTAGGGRTARRAPRRTRGRPATPPGCAIRRRPHDGRKPRSRRTNDRTEPAADRDPHRSERGSWRAADAGAQRARRGRGGMPKPTCIDFAVARTSPRRRARAHPRGPADRLRGPHPRDET